MDVIDFLWILGYISVFFGVIYRFYVNDFDYFLDQGIPGPQPVPVFGNWWNQWNEKLAIVQLERYKKFGRVFGTFDGKTPNLVVGEPALLRKILIKDFDNFVNRIPTVDTKNMYANNMLITLKDFKWKDTKNALAPVFTPENIKKVRGMMTECVDNLVRHLNEKSDKNLRKLDLQSIMTSFASDVIATCGFGTKIDSFANPDDPFAKNSSRLFNIRNLRSNPLVLLIALYPSLGKLIPSQAFREVHYFAKLARLFLEQRRKEANLGVEKRNDFLDMMLEGTSDSSIVLNPLKNDVILTAQLLQFLLAGTDTTSSVLTYLIYNLVIDEEIQDKLRDEILEATKVKGITSDIVNELPYLHKCISETLRLYPPVLAIDRVCSMTTSYEGLKVQKGTFVTIPVYAIHQDPEFYPDPQKFDPERFSPANVANRDSMTYLPFGEGPRSCIGVKLALEEIKLVIAHLLTHFRFRRTIETPEILDFVPGIVPFYQSTKILVSFDKLKTPVPA